MQLYVHPFSPNARRPRLVARALGLEIEEIFVDLATGAHRRPEYLAINPNGKVPALVDGDFRLWESNAIDVYLCRVHGPTALWPEAPRPQADVLRWMFWTHAQWSPPIARLIGERVLKPMRGGTPDDAVCGAAEAEFHGNARVLEAHLAGSTFLVGEHETLADIAVAPNLAFALAARIPVVGYPNILAWSERLEALPHWVATANRGGR